MSGRVRRADTRWATVLSLGVAVYVLALAAAPLLHHDIVCHLKSRTHCTTCVAGVSGPGVANAAAPAPELLTAGGALASVTQRKRPAPPLQPINDRSPPPSL